MERSNEKRESREKVLEIKSRAILGRFSEYIITDGFGWFVVVFLEKL